MTKASKSFVLRLDEATMQAVEKWAADEFRSTNGQLQWIIADALRRSRRLPKHALSPHTEGDKAAESPQTNTPTHN